MSEPASFGRYRVESVLHRGRTGVVYRASFAGSSKHVALKTLDPVVTNDIVLRERFIRGARAISLVRSPHLATLYEVGVQMPTGQVWCAMELIEGRSLADVQASEGLLSPHAVVHVAVQLAEALGAVHAGGVVHRNVKPANVMLTTRGIDPYFVRLVGFGLVKLREADSGEELTARGSVLGTPAYMAPEALIDSSQVDATADVYSLGVVLFEMLTGQLPFSNPSLRSLIDQLMAKEKGAPPLDFEPALDDLVARMLTPDRAARPQSMAEVLEALASCSFYDEATRRDLSAVPVIESADMDSDATLPGKPRRG